MKLKALKPLNHKGKTVEVGKIVEIDDVVAKKLIEVKAAEEIKEVKEQKIETKNLTTGENK
ncbi:DUF7210 family protein [Aliarcobacter lanthieri]|uniref:DUF7210 family protein n=1 Tax=Aliarcobacter lanthieri TaxID=1355374 RepID=UPI00047B3003|nr:hypothetical protein [Aliarcobacter lanthieri]